MTRRTINWPRAISVRASTRFNVRLQVGFVAVQRREDMAGADSAFIVMMAVIGTHRRAQANSRRTRWTSRRSAPSGRRQEAAEIQNLPPRLLCDQIHGELEPFGRDLASLTHPRFFVSPDGSLESLDEASAMTS